MCPAFIRICSLDFNLMTFVIEIINDKYILYLNHNYNTYKYSTLQQKIKKYMKITIRIIIIIIIKVMIMLIIREYIELINR